MEEGSSRKLAVLLHAAVVDSTSLVRLDEVLAHERIQGAFRRFSEIIASHGGTALELRGDALVAEFSMASDAVAAAVSFQTANTDHNQKLPDDIRPAVRVGIAMGEVVVADNTVTGEGIVLAQRLEQLAQPGGLCIQDAAYQTVPKRLPYEYQNLGEHALKGFDEPVRAYTATLKPGEAVPQPVSIARPGEHASQLPDRPSIAVLPFTNMSGDPEQEYFSDGITEDLITELSRFRSLLIIARNSTFTYKGKSVRVQQVAEELGVQYVLEGSVRRAADRVRITAQLIEASTDAQLWAERYDRELDDIFAIQDEVTQSIVGTVAGRIEAAAIDRTRRKTPQSLTAYDWVLRGLHEYNQHELRDHKATSYFEEAVELGPEYARAKAYLALCLFTESFYLMTPEPDFNRALSLGTEAAAFG